jgi:hypothetical protein
MHTWMGGCDAGIKDTDTDTTYIVHAQYLPPSPDVEARVLCSLTGGQDSPTAKAKRPTLSRQTPVKSGRPRASRVPASGGAL